MKDRGLPRARERILVAVLIALLSISTIVPAGRAARAGANNDLLSIAWSVDTKTLDPAISGTNQEIWIFVNIYDQLVRVRRDNSGVQPDLATSWEVSPGGLAYTFHLRRGVTFHNGAPLTADDVKFAIDRARDPNSTWSWTLTAVKTITALDPATLRITLSHPWAPLLSDLALFDTGVYPRAYFQKVGAAGLAQHPVGTGPYQLEEWKHSQYVRLAKNPHYWLAAQYPMAHVEFQLIPNDVTRLLKVESGELDVDNVLPSSLIQQAQAGSGVTVQNNASTLVYYIVPNHRTKPFADPMVRQAINHAIDRASLVKVVFGGRGTPANSFIPKGALDYDAAIPVPSYDPALAQRLLSKSAYPRGFNATMQVQTGDTTYNQIAVIVANELAKVGIHITLRPTDPTTLYNNQAAGKYELIPTFWTNDIPDPDELVSYAIDFSQAAHAFWTNYNNPQLASLVHQAQRARDEATRRGIYAQIQQIYAETVPFFSICYAPFINAVGSRVHGFSEHPLGYFNLQGVSKS